MCVKYWSNVNRVKDKQVGAPGLVTVSLNFEFWGVRQKETAPLVFGPLCQ